MIVLAIDPGTKPGAAVLQDGVVVRVSHDLRDIPVWQAQILAHIPHPLPWPLVATEGQWYYGPQKKVAGEERHVDVNDLLKLAFRAGWQLRDVQAQRYMRIPPQVWRGSSSANKVQMQNRIKRTLTYEEKRLFVDIPQNRHGDVLDSIGIGRAALNLLGTKEYDYP